MATVVVLDSAAAAAETVEVLAATAEVMVALEACTYRTWPRRTHPPFGSD